jgi:Kef-type K+ transport system membrane component KefB
MESSLAVAIGLVAAAGLALELRVSSAILEILAGVCLAWLLGDLHQLEWLEFLAHLGALALMFMAGFEIEVERLRRTWRSCVATGALSLLAPMTGTFAVAHFVFGLDPMAAALVGIALSTTSLALVYQALRDEDMLRRPEGQTLLASATVVDVLSMLALALLLGDAGWGTGVVILIVAFTVIGLPRVGGWVFRRYANSMVEAELRFILVLLLGMGFMAENVGSIHPAVVAFALGVAMSGLVDRHRELKAKLKGLVFGFFAPAFFMHAGTQLDVTLLSPEVLGIAAVLFTVACALKYLGTALPAARLLGVSGTMAGVLFNYRLSFGIIAANVGLASGVLSQEIYAVILLVVVCSAALPMLLLRDRPSEWNGPARREATAQEIRPPAE